MIAKYHYLTGGPLLNRIGKGLISRMLDKYRYIQDARVPFPARHSTSPNCVIGNAPPKSGTYLLNSILNYLDIWNNLGIHLLPRHYIDFGDYKGKVDTPRIYRPAGKCVRDLRNGQLVAAHLPWNEQLGKAFNHRTADREIKHLLMIRDPRDAAVSYMRYATYADNFTHDQPTRDFRRFMLDGFSNDDERLEEVIKRRLVKPEFLVYVNWLNHPNTHVLRFEDLYRELCGLGVDGFGPTFEGLFEYLGVDIDRYDALSLQHSVLGSSLTSSGLKNKIEQYRAAFKDQHHKWIDNSEFRRNLEKFSYRW